MMEDNVAVLSHKLGMDMEYINVCTKDNFCIHDVLKWDVLWDWDLVADL